MKYVYFNCFSPFSTHFQTGTISIFNPSRSITSSSSYVTIIALFRGYKVFMATKAFISRSNVDSSLIL